VGFAGIAQAEQLMKLPSAILSTCTIAILAAHFGRPG
jgi:hypothetical protein